MVQRQVWLYNLSDQCKMKIQVPWLKKIIKISRWSLFRRGECYTVCGILVPRPGIQAGYGSESVSPNQWTAREFCQDGDGRALKQGWVPMRLHKSGTCEAAPAQRYLRLKSKKSHPSTPPPPATKFNFSCLCYINRWHDRHHPAMWAQKPRVTFDPPSPAQLHYPGHHQPLT